MTLREVDGGPSYYATFEESLPSHPAYFPIGVWFESVLSRSDVAKDEGAGLNLYVALTADSRLPAISANGMNVIAQYEDWVDKAEAPGSEAIAGWLLADEIDMRQADAPGAAAARDELRRIQSSLPQDGRLRYNNYGKGVTFWSTDADATKYASGFQSVVSADNYWFTDPNVCGRSEGGSLLATPAKPLAQPRCRTAANYGETVRRLRELVRPAGSKPVWAFVEVGHPFTEDRARQIAPGQLKAAVWHSLIARARGIVYFNHSFGGACPTQHALREPCYADVREAVEETNALVKRLAPVLNAPSVVSGWSHGAGTRAMVKWANGHFYVFAGSGGSPVNGRFSLPCIGDATASVLDEDRSIPVRGGSFTDSFANGNAIHIYRVDGGSTCALTAGQTTEPDSSH